MRKLGNSDSNAIINNEFTLTVRLLRCHGCLRKERRKEKDVAADGNNNHETFPT